MTSHNDSPNELRRPWSPTQIAMLSLLLTPLSGGILHALNYARLGAPARKRLALFSNLITGTAVLLPSFFLRAPLGASLGMAMFASAYFYKSQAQLFQAHLSRGGRKASLVWPVVLTIAGALALAIGLVIVEMLVRLRN